MELTKSEKWFAAASDKGCAFTGKKLPHLPYNGVEYAHIVARDYAGRTAHEANGFPLSPDQHSVFDKLVKKKLLKAYIWSLCRQDFKRAPKNKKMESLQPDERLCRDADEFLAKLLSAADLYQVLHDLSADKEFSSHVALASKLKPWIAGAMSETNRPRKEDGEEDISTLPPAP